MSIQDKIAARAAAAIERQGSYNDTQAGGGDLKPFKIAPEGKAKARLVGYIELGKQVNKSYPEKAPVNNFKLRFALFGAGDAYIDEQGQPLTVDSRPMTVSRSEKANAVKLFQQMCPKRDADHFLQLLGRAFWVEVKHVDGKPQADGTAKKYANLVQESVKPAVRDILDDEDNVIGTKEVACPEAPDDMYVIFEAAFPTKEDFDKLKAYEQDMVRKSVGYAGSAMAQVLGEAPVVAAPAEAKPEVAKAAPASNPDEAYDEDFPLL